LAERHREVREFHHQFNARRRRALVDAIAQGVEAGEIADHATPEAAAIALAGAITYQRLMTDVPFDPARVDELIRSVLGDPPAVRP
jgi:hypothetical protein